MFFIRADIVESSAKISAMHSLNTSGRSLIYITNSVGPSTEPLGTPETTLPQCYRYICVLISIFKIR